MTCQHCQETDRIFKPWMLRHQLTRYRNQKLDKATRLLIQGLKKSLRKPNEKQTSLIDVGGGIGIIYLELLKNEISQATHIDASENYLLLAKEETVRHGFEDRVKHIKGDFVDLAARVEPSHSVVMDKVICCYPDIRSLLQAAAHTAKTSIALSFPGEKWYFKAPVFLANAVRKMRGLAFRNYIHKQNEIEQTLRSLGFEPVYRSKTFFWRILVFERSL